MDKYINLHFHRRKQQYKQYSTFTLMVSCLGDGHEFYEGGLADQAVAVGVQGEEFGQLHKTRITQ